jgi:hypothetical protein
MLKHADSKTDSRAKIETVELRAEIAQQDRFINDLVKGRSTTKLKLGKENLNRNPVVWEMKVEKLQTKIG